MKKKLSMLITVCMITLLLNIPAVAAEENYVNYVSRLSDIVTQYDSDDYFSSISITIGEKELNIDGESVPIDNSGSVAYVENGRTMLPVRGIAEAMGAEVSFDDTSNAVKVESNEVSLMMFIGENVMSVNGEEQELLTAPEIKNDRTMLPMRDVAEALNCEVEWNGDTQTATITKSFQTKRIIVFSEKADTSNAVAVVHSDDITILQYDTITEAQKAAEVNESMGYTVEPDCIRKISSLSWGVNTIGSEKYCSQTSGKGTQSIVAVIDTGVDTSHNFLSGRLVPGYDIYNNDNTPEDYIGHGTHVSSTVIDVAQNNKNVVVMPVKVFGNNDTTSDTMVAAGIEYAVNNNADVINLSLGGKGVSEIQNRAVKKALEKNVTVVAAAGNKKMDLSKEPFSPAVIDGVVTVSAIDKNGRLASFSNYGAIDFAAPGVSIYGAKAGGGYCTKSGTSMASPHVAGVYGLVKSIHPELTTDQITAALKSNTTSKDNPYHFGAGVIRVSNLENLLPGGYKEPNPEPSALTISPDSYPSGTLTPGSSFRLSGRIKSNYHITDVRSYILDSNQNVLQEASGWTTTKTYVIEGSALDRGLEFGNLSQGTYYLKFYAADEGGKSTIWISDAFSIASSTLPPVPTPEPAPPVKSALYIEPWSYPSEITQGNSFGLSGRIKSDYHITDVRSYILDANGNILQEGSGWTTTKTYVIEGSALDKGLKFGDLSAGTYSLKLYAADESGNSVVWQQNFSVAGTTAPPPAKSGLYIEPWSYPKETIRADSFNLSGRIKSDYHITGVWSYLLDSNKNVLQEASGWTTTKTYVIENSALDRGIKFQNASPGSYYLKYRATDESGNEITWISDLFNITG